MKLGLHIPQTTWQGGAVRFGPLLAEVVEAAVDRVAPIEVMAREVIPAAAELR